MKNIAFFLITVLSLSPAGAVFGQLAASRPVNAVARAVAVLGPAGARATGVSSLISLAQGEVSLRSVIPVLEAVSPEDMSGLLRLLEQPQSQSDLAKELVRHFKSAEGEAESRVAAMREAVEKGVEVDAAQINELLDPMYEPFVSEPSKAFVAALRQARSKARDEKTRSVIEEARQALGISAPKAEDALWDISRAQSDFKLYAGLKESGLEGLLQGAERRDPTVFWEQANAILDKFSDRLHAPLDYIGSYPVGPWAREKLNAYSRQTVKTERLIANLKLSQGIAGGLLLGRGSKGGVEADRLVPARLRRQIEQTSVRGQKREISLRASAWSAWRRLMSEHIARHPALLAALLEGIRRDYAALLKLAASNADAHHLESLKAQLSGRLPGLPSIPELRAFWDKSVADAALIGNFKIDVGNLAVMQFAFPAVYGLAVSAMPLLPAPLIVLSLLGVPILAGALSLAYRLGRNRFEDFGKMGGRWRQMLDFVSGKERALPQAVASSGRTWLEALCEAFLSAVLAVPITGMVLMLAHVLFGGLGAGAILALYFTIYALANGVAAMGASVRVTRTTIEK